MCIYLHFFFRFFSFPFFFFEKRVKVRKTHLNLVMSSSYELSEPFHSGHWQPYLDRYYGLVSRHKNVRCIKEPRPKHCSQRYRLCACLNGQTMRIMLAIVRFAFSHSLSITCALFSLSFLCRKTS